MTPQKTYIHTYIYIQGGPKKTALFLRLDNFLMASDRKVYDTSKVAEFYPEKFFITFDLVFLNILCLICIKLRLPRI